MNWLKRTLIGLLISSCISAAASYLLIVYKLQPYLKETIQTQGSEILGAPLTVEDVRLAVYPKIYLGVNGAKFTIKSTGNIQRSLSVQAGSAEVSIDFKLLDWIGTGPVGTVVIRLNQPKVHLEQTVKADQVAEESATGIHQGTPLPIVTFGRPVGLDFKILRGEVDVIQNGKPLVTAREIGFGFSSTDLNTHVYNVELRSDARYSYDDIQIPFPISIAMKLGQDPVRFKVSEIRGSLLDIGIQDGEILIEPASRTISGKLHAFAPDLALLPKQPAFLPPGKYKGQTDVKIDFVYNDALTWLTNISLKLTNVTGETKFTHSDVSVAGSIRASADITVSVKGAGPSPTGLPYTIRVDKSSLELDLTDAVVAKGVEEKPDKHVVFTKPAGTTLYLSSAIDGDLNLLRILHLNMALASVRASVIGEYSYSGDQISQLKLNIERSPIDGWEKFFPVLSGSMLKGFLTLDGVVRGDFKDPSTLSIILNAFKLENIQAGLKWTDRGSDKATARRFEGLALINGAFSGGVNGRALTNADFKINADLTGALIGFPNQFVKSPGAPLKFNFIASKATGPLEINRSSFIQVGHSVVGISGTVTGFERPNFDIGFNTNQIALSELSETFPSIKGYGLNGSAQAALKLQGAFDPKLGFEKSPLSLVGDSKMQMAALHFPIAAFSDPVLPDWPLFRTMRIKNELQLAEFSWAAVSATELRAHGLRFVTQIDRGIWSGIITIQNLFSAAIRIDSFKTDLSSINPVTSAHVIFNDLRVQDAASYASPSWNGTVNGRLNGSANVTFPPFSSSDLKSQVSASGEFDLKELTYSSSIDSRIRQVLLKTPGLSKPHAPKPALPQVVARFDLKNAVFHFSDLTLETPENIQMKATGTLGFDKTIDLNGTARVSGTNQSIPVRIKEKD